MRAFIVALCLGFAATPALAGPFEDGKRAASIECIKPEQRNEATDKEAHRLQKQIDTLWFKHKDRVEAAREFDRGARSGMPCRK